MEYMLLIYHNEEEATQRPEADKQRIFQEFAAFTEDVKKSGKRKAGGPLEFTRTAATVRFRDGKTMVTDGPFAETKEVAGGFNLVACASIDEAITWANKLAARDGDAIEVRPVEGCWWIYHE